MLATMMHQPLLVSAVLEHANRFHGEQEIVSRTIEGEIFRYSYRGLSKRSKQLANSIQALQ